MNFLVKWSTIHIGKNCCCFDSISLSLETVLHVLFQARPDWILVLTILCTYNNCWGQYCSWYFLEIKLSFCPFQSIQTPPWYKNLQLFQREFFIIATTQLSISLHFINNGLRGMKSFLQGMKQLKMRWVSYQNRHKWNQKGEKICCLAYHGTFQG